VAGTGKGITQRQIVLGRRIAKRRQKLGLGQERLALDAGLHRTYLTTVERGMRNPSLETLCRIANALGCDVSDLVKGLQAEHGRVE
jgi:transcriptional regulator with XRE-family HTH domain